MTIPNKTFTDGMHFHQLQVLEAFDRQTPWAKELAAWCFWLEWARRHRKTTLAVNLQIREACRYARSKYLYLSPYQSETRKMVWDDPIMLTTALPAKNEMDYTMNETKMLVKFENGSMIQFGGADEPDSWRGNDCLGAVLDERAQMKESIWTEILLPIIAGPLPPHLVGTGAFRWVMNLYTPKGINHATMGFDKACCISRGGTLPVCGRSRMMKPGYYASRLDAELAGIMTTDALAIAKEESKLLAIYEQEFKCRRTTEEERTLITSAMLDKLLTINWDATRRCDTETRKIVSIDPAFGGDMAVVTGLVNGRIPDGAKSRIRPNMTNELIMEGKKVAQIIGTKNFICDGIGNGKGVSDGLMCDAAGYNVQVFKSSQKPSDHPTKKGEEQSIFANKRAESYFYTGQQISKLAVEAIEDAELRRQLPIASRYKTNGAGKLIIIPKDIIKKPENLGCSPDDADSYTMGVYGLQFVDPEETPASTSYTDTRMAQMSM